MSLEFTKNFGLAYHLSQKREPDKKKKKKRKRNTDIPYMNTDVKKKKRSLHAFYDMRYA